MVFETQKLKLIVTILTMCAAVDGLLKISSNLTMLYYFHESKFFHFLIGRIIVGGLLTIWSYYGLAVLFYDFIIGIVVYSSGILLLTVADAGSLILKVYLSDTRWTHIFDTDEFTNKGLQNNKHLRFGSDSLKQNVLEEILTWLFLTCQIMIFFFGLFLAARLSRHKEDQERYNRNLARLHELRKENQAHDKKKEHVVNVTHLR